MRTKPLHVSTAASHNCLSGCRTLKLSECILVRLVDTSKKKIKKKCLSGFRTLKLPQYILVRLMDRQMKMWIVRFYDDTKNVNSIFQ